MLQLISQDVTLVISPSLDFQNIHQFRIMCLYFVHLVTRYGSHFGRIDLVKNSLVLKFGDFGVVSYDVLLEFGLVFEVGVAFLLLFFKTNFYLFKV